MKQYLIAGVITSLFIHSPVHAETYNKDNDRAQMMRSTHYSKDTFENSPVIQKSSNIVSPAKTQTNTQYQSPQEENPKLDPGFYLGGYGGYSWTDTDTASQTADVNGVDYGVFFGTDMDILLNGWMGLTGAIEGFYGWSNADDMVTVAGSPVNIEKDHEWGVNIRPGLTFADKYTPFDLKPYGILGYRRANFDTSGPAGSSNEDFNGFELGIGTELVAYDSIGIRLDYSHVFYKEEAGIDPDENDLRLGIAYHF